MTYRDLKFCAKDTRLVIIKLNYARYVTYLKISDIHSCQKLECSNQWVNHNQVDKYNLSYVIQRILIYPMESAIQKVNIIY